MERKLQDSPEARRLREAAVVWAKGFINDDAGLNDERGAKRDEGLLDAAIAYAAAVRKSEETRLALKVPSNACPARTRRCASQDGACMVLSGAKVGKNAERWCAYCGKKAELTPAETLQAARALRRRRMART
jgi:hypothetical protein